MRVLITVEDESVIADALAKYGKRDVYLKMDETVANRNKALALGLDRYALVGADADESLFAEVIGKTTAKKPAKKAKKPLVADKDIVAVVEDAKLEE
jgi:hypothetical protein